MWQYEDKGHELAEARLKSGDVGKCEGGELRCAWKKMQMDCLGRRRMEEEWMDEMDE